MLGESSETPPGREQRKKGALGGTWFPPKSELFGLRPKSNASAPGRIRTSDLALRRRALYPLSYGRGETAV